MKLSQFSRISLGKEALADFITMEHFIVTARSFQNRVNERPFSYSGSLSNPAIYEAQEFLLTRSADNLTIYEWKQAYFFPNQDRVILSFITDQESGHASGEVIVFPDTPTVERWMRTHKCLR